MKVPKLFLILLLIIFSVSSLADERVYSMTFGPVKLGESRIPINIKDFKINNPVAEMGVKAQLLDSEAQWVRDKFNLLTPRVRVGIQIKPTATDLHIVYQGRSIIPEHHQSFLYTEVYMALFHPAPIHISRGGKRLGSITISSTPPLDKKQETQLIDYSCSKFGLEIEGLSNEYLSVGCRLYRVGKYGNEMPRLEITWATTNYRLLDNSEPPYVVILSRGEKAKIRVKNGLEIKDITFKARIPKRMHRLNLAMGFGPYLFSAEDGDEKRLSKPAPSLMLYANHYLTPSTSIRAFDALVTNKSAFNNFGTYFAYEVGAILDGRLSVVPLLGFQHLYFQYSEKDAAEFDFIYPQGFEVGYHHAFGLENYHLFYGMFIDASSSYDYKNIWTRFGKKYFWELNWIEWQRGKYSASMWGLSVGIPLGSFF